MSNCPCQPGNLYRGGLPTWNPPKTDEEATCAYNLLGLNSNDPCYSDCYTFPIPCYGYALNIATPDSWTYPGLRHQTTEPDVNNCQQLITQTVADGSIYFGMSEPTKLASDQHIFVGYASPEGTQNGQYHYIRKDTYTNSWSSKNGMDEPVQLIGSLPPKFDLNGSYLEFCGYFITSNDAVCPSDTDCVKGYQTQGDTAWPGCGISP